MDNAHVRYFRRRQVIHQTRKRNLLTYWTVALLLQLFGDVRISSIDPTDPNAVSKAKKGKKIAQIGVAIQLVCFGLFIFIAIRFNFTSKRFIPAFEQRLSTLDETTGKPSKYVRIDDQEPLLKKNWQAILRVTNIASLCILVRIEAPKVLTFWTTY